MSTRGDRSRADTTLVTPSLLRGRPLPASGEDKYSRGSVLVIGGGRATLPECGVTGLPETADGSVTGEGLDRVSSSLTEADTVLVGPGLDDLDLAEEMLRRLLEREESAGGPHGSSRPAVVLDAFALGVLARLEEKLGPWRAG